MDTALRKFVAAASLTVTLGVAAAHGAVRFVDGACATSGTGATLTCGATGPFRTINEGIVALQPGDTLNVRGAHGTFNGVYFESLGILDGGGVSGKSLACTVGQPCVIQGCRAATCGVDEQPVVRGMTLRSDWTSLGGGVYRRTMEATPNQDPLARDAYDPTILIDGSTTPFTVMGYAGDSVTTPTAGQWSYTASTHQITVHPAGTADPSTTIFVPHYGFNVRIQSPSAYVTVQYLTFEGVRGYSIHIESLGITNPIAGITLSHLVQRFAARKFIQSTRGCINSVIEDTVSEYGGRGISYATTTDDGFFGYRLFGFHNGIVRRNTIRHIGTMGRVRISGGTSWPCPWCDAPWNTTTNTQISTSGTAYQVKQTDTVTIEDNVAEDVSTVGISLDVSRHVTVQRNRISRASTGIGMRNFTPTAGCPSTSTSQFCYNSDHIVRDNVLDQVGYQDAAGVGINVLSGNARAVGSTMLAQVYNNMVSHVGFAGIYVATEDGTPVSDVSVWNNTVYGARSVTSAVPGTGIMIPTSAQNVAVRDNAVDGVTADGIMVASAAASGVTMDGDVLGTVSGCQVRWGSGSCDTLATHEAHGRTGALRFANVNATPPDLHLTTGSVAIDAGVADAVTSDMDGNARPQGIAWDAGAEEFVSGGATTSTTSTSTTSSTTTTRPSTTSSTTIRATTTTTATASTSTSTTRPSTTSTTASTSTTRPSTTSTTASTSTTRPSTTSTTASTSTTRPTTSSTTTSTSSTTSPPTTSTTLGPRANTCGNGIVEAGEQCDDGNIAPLDGCDASCLVEQIAWTASGTVVGTTIAPPADSIGASVSSPAPGRLVVVETSTTMSPPAGYVFAGRQVHIEAPPASVATPLVVAITAAPTVFGPAGPPGSPRVFRNGVVIPPCGTTFPDPCLESRTSFNGVTQLTIVASAGGEWNVGARVATATVDQCVVGNALLLQDAPRRLALRSRDASGLVLGDAASVSALVAAGGNLHVRAVGGDGFDTTYPLDAANWHLLRPLNPSYGLGYRSATGPITRIVFKAGRLLTVAGRGAGLVQTLGSEPDGVEVELQLGDNAYRLEFGGDKRTFTPDRKLLLGSAGAAACAAQ